MARGSLFTSRWNLEHFSFGEGLGAQLAPSGGIEPDVLNYAWRDYGNRVGVWRMLAEFDRLSLPVGVLVNSEIYDYCPEVMDAFRRRGDEVVGHGRTNSERQSALASTEEAVLIADVTATIAKHELSNPRGWLGPWISESVDTPDLLKAAKTYDYVLDWCHDDQPTWLQTAHGPLLSIPYPQEINDIPAIVVRKVGAAEFADMIIDQLQEMSTQSQQQPLGRWNCAASLLSWDSLFACGTCAGRWNMWRICVTRPGSLIRAPSLNTFGVCRAG